MDSHAQNAPETRAEWEELHDQIVTVKSSLTFKELAAATSENVLVLNTHMQIVFITRRCLDLCGISDPAEVYGCRIGEILQCKHSAQNGCCTSPKCQFCGAAKAIQSSLRGKPESTCFSVVNQSTGKRTDFQIETQPINLKGNRYILLSLR